MAIDDQIAALLAQNADLFAVYEEWSNGQIMLLAGTVDDPNSFDEAGGKSGALGYYPVVNVSGQTIYVACVARLKAIALGGANAAVLEELVGQVGGKLAAVDSAIVATNTVRDQTTAAIVATGAVRDQAQAEGANARAQADRAEAAANAVPQAIAAAAKVTSVLPDTAVPGFAFAVLGLDGSVAAGVRDSGALAAAAVEADDVTAKTFNGVDGARIAGAGAAISPAVIPGFQTAWMALDGTSPGGVRDDGVLDMDEMKARKVAAAQAVIASLTGTTARFDTLNGSNVDGLIAGLSNASDFAPLYQRSDIRYPLIAKSTVIADMVAVGAAGGWGATTFGNGSAVIQDDPRRAGKKVMRVNDFTANGSAGYILLRRKVTKADMAAGKIELAIEIPATATGTSVNLIYSSDAPASDPPSATLPTNRRSVGFGPAYFVNDARSRLTISLDSAVAAPVTWANAGAPDPKSIKSIFIEINFGSAGVTGQRYVLIEEVGLGGRSQSFVTYTFDGYLDATLKYAVPLFDKYGLKGAFCIDSNLIATNLGKLEQLYNHDWDVVPQGVDHRNYGTSPDLFAADYDASQAALAGAGYPTVPGKFAWPSAASTAATRAQARAKGVKWARAANFPRTPFTSLGGSELVNVGAYDFGSAASATTWNGYVSENALCGDLVCFLGHEAIPSGTPTALQYLAPQLDAHLAATVATPGVRVVTPTQYLRAIGAN